MASKSTSNVGGPPGRSMYREKALQVAIENFIDYEFSGETTAISAIKDGPKRTYYSDLLSTSTLKFGDDTTIAAAVRESGFDKVIYKKPVEDSTLAKTIKALLGCIYWEMSDENDVVRAAVYMGLDEVEDEESLDEAESAEQDLLGADDFKFVPFVASGPVVESLI